MPHFNVLYTLDTLAGHPAHDGLNGLLYIPPWVSPPEKVRRRVWAAAPAGRPEFTFRGVTLAPVAVHDGPVRWLDYGEVEIDCGPRVSTTVRGIEAGACHRTHLVVSEDLGLDLKDATLEEAERRMYGMARADAGRTSLWPNRVEVGRPAAFTVRYEAGPKGLPAGHRVQFVVPRAFARPQTDDPDAPGYLEVLRADATLGAAEIGTYFQSHEKIAIILPLESDLPAGGGIVLRYRTETTYLFDSEWNNTEMPSWHALVPVLSASVSTGDRESWVWLARGNGHSLAFEPGPAERVHLFLPGRLREGAAFTLRGTVTDRYRNTPRTRAPLPLDIDLVLMGKEGETVLAGPEAHMIVPHRFEVPLPSLTPGVYRVEARKRADGTVAARSNPVEVMPLEDPRAPVYWGEIHTHTERSDGYGRYEELYRHARDEGALDFAAASDHIGAFSEVDWLQMQDITDAFHVPERYCTLQAYEFAGHCVYGARPRLAPCWEEMREMDAFFELHQDDPEVALGPHGHKAILQGNDAERPDGVERDFVQIYGTFGACDATEGPLVQVVTEKERENRGLTVHDVLATGEKLGFTGGGDIHCGRAGFSNEDPDRQGEVAHDIYHNHPYRDGMTAALMERLDRPDLVRALKERRTYATTGARILLEFRVGDVPMGGIGATEEARCEVVVHAVAPLASIRIVKDGAVVAETSPGGFDASWSWRDPEPPAAEHYYYVRAEQADGEVAWSSPVWIRPPKRQG